jgi:GalNAc-alpha-(1->4)-GalNAc-alpha-(1->3)-diNAcBac-PP-undecaprenol alpha-1,4-N-acetyl-D-galactosaminyltransferase
MNKKKIFFFISSMELGGAEKQVYLLIKKLQKKFNISLITFKNKNTDFYKLDQEVKRYCFPIRKNMNFFSKLLSYFLLLVKIRKIFFKQNPQTVIGFLPIPSLIMLLAIRGNKTKKIISIRNNPDFQKINIFWNILNFFLQKSANEIVVQTNSLKNKLKHKFKNKNITVIPNLIFFLKGKNKKKNIINPPNTKFLLSVGKIHWQKGFDILLDSYLDVIKNKKINLFILSNSVNIDYNHYKILKRKITNNNISKQVKILFDVANIDKWYKKSHLYIQSSRFEGYPNSLLEALNNKSKVFAFNCEHGPKEIIKLFKSGKLMPISSKILTKNIIHFLDKKLKLKKPKTINIKIYEKKIIKLWLKKLNH